MKYQRHMKIMELVQSGVIETQDQLMALLKESGYNVTQATVSRDIKELRLYKRVSRNGTARYEIEGGTTDYSEQPERFKSILKDGIRTIDTAGNILVIKCYSGMAQAVCAAVDALRFEGMVGSIAGDDTIFAAMRNESVSSDFVAYLRKISD